MNSSAIRGELSFACIIYNFISGNNFADCETLDRLEGASISSFESEGDDRPEEDACGKAGRLKGILIHNETPWVNK